MNGGWLRLAIAFDLGGKPIPEPAGDFGELGQIGEGLGSVAAIELIPDALEGKAPSDRERLKAAETSLAEDVLGDDRTIFGTTISH